MDGKITQDIFLDDQSLILDTKKGLVVILGCAHSGMINILDHVNRNFTQRSLNSTPYRFPYPLSFRLLFFLTSSTFCIGTLLSLSGVSPILPFFFIS
jgi:hypothetical protein